MTSLSETIALAKQAKLQRQPAQDIVQKIYDGYIVDEIDGYKKKKSFAPSGLFYGSGVCARRWVLSFNGGTHEPKIAALQSANMKNGILAHQRIQAAMVASGMVKEIEREVRSQDPPILGFADAILEHDKVYVCEIKTTSHRNFEYRRQTGKIADYHIGQVLIYMYVLDIPDAIVIYESKDTNELFGIIMTMTDEYHAIVERWMTWMRDVWKLYEFNDMPTRGFRKNSKVCKTCPVETICDETQDGWVKMERLPIEL